MTSTRKTPENSALRRLDRVARFSAFAQTPASTILTVEMENVVQYQENFANPQKNGTSAVNGGSDRPPEHFSPGYFIADIAAINGKKSKGTTFARNLYVNFNPNPSGSQAIADIDSLSGHGNPA